MKKQKGITLIALVITIIVLLILAGITIAMIAGQDSAPQKAVEARNANDLGAMKDEVALLVSNNNITSNTFKQNLENQFGKDKIEEIGDEGYELTHVFYVTKRGKTYTVFQNGDVEEGKVDVWDGRASTIPTNKDDTNKIIHITKCSELRWLAEQTNSNIEGTTFAGYTVYLDNDLDFGAREIDGEWENEANGKLLWEPIGILNNANQKFEGIFDGQKHTIKGVYVNQNTMFGGIFGNSNSIINLIIKDSYIKVGSGAGGIVAALRNTDGIITNCHNINTTVISQYYLAGGVVGQFTGSKIENSSNSGNIKNIEGYSGFSAVGGVVGSVNGSGIVSNCYNLGNVEGIGYNIGGICAQLGKYGTSNILSSCYNSGKISSKNGENVGGIIGYCPSGSKTVFKTYNKGQVINNGTCFGSIIGLDDSGNNISNCYYLNISDLKAIGSETESTDDLTNNVKTISQDFKTYEEFLAGIDSIE